jgi:hypothetical protein
MRLKRISALLILLATIFLMLGIRLADDYGLGWDEPVARMGGITTYRYVVDGDQTLIEYRDRYYGPAFEVMLYALEKMIGTTDPYTIFVIRHTATFLLFFVSVIAMYMLAKEVFGAWWWGLVGAVFLVLHPRIFAESFYNSKDIGFLASWVIGTLLGYRYYIKPTVSRAIFFGLATAFATDIRIVGVLLHSIGLVVCIRSFLRKKYAGIRSYVVYVITAVVFTVLWWPVLWGNPVPQFANAIQYMITFNVYEKNVLYGGKFLAPQEVPWHYLPVWVGITTPASILLLWVVGACRILLKKHTFWHVFSIGISVGVVMLVAIFRPALYDGWRQFYFIYPAIILTAIAGLKWMVRLPQMVRVGIAAVVAVNMGVVMLFMVRNHPHQYVYFNELAGGVAGAEAKFDLDYWGVSYRKGLEYIADIDPRPEIRVFFAFGIGAHADVLQAQHRRFVPVTSLEDADYILSNFRWQKQKPPMPVLYYIRVDNIPIMGVYANTL